MSSVGNIEEWNHNSFTFLQVWNTLVKCFLSKTVCDNETLSTTKGRIRDSSLKYLLYIIILFAMSSETKSP